MSDSLEERLSILEEKLTVQAQALDAAFLLVCAIFVFSKLTKREASWSRLQFSRYEPHTTKSSTSKNLHAVSVGENLLTLQVI